MTPFSVSAACSAGWTILRRRYLLLVGLSCLYLVLIVAASCVPFGTILLLPFIAGCIHVGVRDWRGQPVTTGDAFAVYKTRFLDLLVVGLLLSLTGIVSVVPAMLGVFALIALPAAIENDATALAIVLGLAGGGFILVALLISTYLASRLTFAHFIVLDRAEPGFYAVEAFKESWALTRPHHLGLFVLFVLLTLISTLSLLLLGIGFVLLGTPLWFAVVAGAYVLLRGEPDANRQGF